MFILISSNSERLFQRGILDVLALPLRHPITFRYQTKYVAPAVSNAIGAAKSQELLRVSGRQALIIYAQKPNEDCDSYQYCPVRLAEITSLRLQGDIVFVEMALGECANMQLWHETSESRAAFLRAMRERPGSLAGNTGQGYFLDVVKDCDWGLWSDEHTEGAVWQTVVDRLAVMPSMSNCLFYRVRGFFSPGRRSIFGSMLSESTVVPKYSVGSLVFPIPMSRPVDLKLLFYRPSNAQPKTINAAFDVNVDKSGFSDIPDRRILLESRYDEISIRLATRRVFDNTLAPVSIKLRESTPKEVLVSEPLLLCVVRVPSGLLVILVTLLFLAPLLLSITSEDVAWIVSRFPEDIDTQSVLSSARLAVYSKVLGGLVAAIAGFIIFRRFPVSK